MTVKENNYVANAMPRKKVTKAKKMEYLDENFDNVKAYLKSIYGTECLDMELFNRSLGVCRALLTNNYKMKIIYEEKTIIIMKKDKGKFYIRYCRSLKDVERTLEVLSLM